MNKYFYQKIKNYTYHLAEAIVSQLYFRWPSHHLKVILVSGTDGKTTTATWLYHLLQASGKKSGLISTIKASWTGQEIPTGLHTTTPRSWQLNKLIHQMVKDGVEYLVLEITSHGIDQFRDWGIKPEVYIITNITHEHLDYHPSFNHYILTKLKPGQKANWIVYNADDPVLKKKLAKQKKALGISLENSTLANLTIKNLRKKQPNNHSLIQVRSKTPQLNLKLLTPYPQKYNLTNLALALQAAIILKLDLSKLNQAVYTLPPIKGRLEKIDDGGENFNIYVDFAHTPNGLKNILSYLSKIKAKRKRLIAVFGSAGERDKSKRPLMTQAASQYADIIILTSEDPRSEEPKQIIAQMIKGFPTDWSYQDKIENLKKKNYLVIEDRSQAIETAINLAKEGDIVGIFGKGHEQSMCYGKTEIPWDDIKEAKKHLWNRVIKNRVAGVVLAAGKGTRISSLTKNKINKAMVPVLGKPMVGWARDLLTASGINNQIYVIGHKAKAIKDYLGPKTNWVIQKEQLGTGHAAKHALTSISNKIRHLLILNADQAFYPKDVLLSFINFYLKGNYDAAILSTLKENPTGLGRIVRNSKGNLTRIVEERDASPKIKKIKEINTGTYIFKRDFLGKYINLLPLHQDKNEYYLTDIFAIALKDNRRIKIGVLQNNHPLVNLGFNTPEQLEQGEKLLKRFYPLLNNGT